MALSESAALAVRPGPSVVVVQQPAPAAKDQAVTPQPVEILIQAPPSPSPEREPWPPAGGEMLGLRRQVLRFGLEGLPDPPALLSQAEGAAPAPVRFPDTPRLTPSLRTQQGARPGRSFVMRYVAGFLALAVSLPPRGCSRRR